jgi:hypothetical protein
VFESLSGHSLVSSSLFVLSFAGRGFPMGIFPIQGTQTNFYKNPSENRKTGGPELQADIMDLMFNVTIQYRE